MSGTDSVPGLVVSRGVSRCVRDHSMKSDKPFGSELVSSAFLATKRSKALSFHSVYVGFLGFT